MRRKEIEQYSDLDYEYQFQIIVLEKSRKKMRYSFRINIMQNREQLNYKKFIMVSN